MSPRHEGGSTRGSPPRERLDRASESRRESRRSRHGAREPAERRRPLGAQHITAPPIRHGAGCDDLRRLAAAQLQDQPRRDLQPVPDKCRVEAALEAIAGVARDVELAAGRRGADRIEERGLDEDLGRRFGAAGRLAADHAAEALHAGAVGDDRHFRIERVFLSVECEQGFAGPREPHRQVAREPAGIEDVQRPVEIEGQKIRDVDERRDRPQPDRLEPVRSQPGSARCGCREYAARETAGRRSGPRYGCLSVSGSGPEQGSYRAASAARGRRRRDRGQCRERRGSRRGSASP